MYSHWVTCSVSTHLQKEKEAGEKRKANTLKVTFRPGDFPPFPAKVRVSSGRVQPGTGHWSGEPRTPKPGDGRPRQGVRSLGRAFLSAEANVPEQGPLHPRGPTASSPRMLARRGGRSSDSAGTAALPSGRRRIPGSRAQEVPSLASPSPSGSPREARLPAAATLTPGHPARRDPRARPGGKEAQVGGAARLPAQEGCPRRRPQT